MKDHIVKELKLIFEKEAKEIFSKEKSEEEFQIQKRNYDKYNQICLDNLEEIDLNKLQEESKKLEDEIKGKLSDIDKMEESLKELFIGTSQELPVDKYNHIELCQSLFNLKEQSNDTSFRLDNLENQSLDSIKKMKIDFENRNESELLNLKEILKGKDKELEGLLSVKAEKLKALEEKESTHSSNQHKVSLKEHDYNLVIEKFNAAHNKNQLILEEIQSYGVNINLMQTEIKSLEERIKSKENSVGSSTLKKNLLICEKDCSSSSLNPQTEKELLQVKNIQTENLNYKREIENNKMAVEDYVLLSNKRSENENIVNDKRCNILSLIGIMMNCLLQHKKKAKIETELRSSDEDFAEFERAKNIFEEVKTSEAKLNKEKEKCEILRKKIERTKETIRRREIMLSKL